MPNTLSVVDHKADYFTNYFKALEMGLYTTSSAGTELTGTALFSTDAGTMELRLDYVTIDGEIHVTGLSGWDEGVEAFTATFADPEPMGVPVWTDMRPLSLHEALLGDTRFDVRGSRADDVATGTSFGDRFVMRGGDDIAVGGGGNDDMRGGKGDDLLIGGADDDVLRGGKDNDMLIAGSGDDKLKGGAGNDVLIMVAGDNRAVGGAGSDMFIFNTDAGGGLNGPRTKVTDHKADDFMVFTGVASTAGGNPEGFTGETLADLTNGLLDDFQWRETKRGMEIEAGDSFVFVKGVGADDISLDQLVFTEQSAQEVALLFDGSANEDVLGYSASGDAFIAFGTEGSTFIAFGEESTGFIAFGTEGTGFIA